MSIHPERHYMQRIGWLRAAVLGANDGIVSTAALLVGVAAAASGRAAILVAGLAGLVAGAMSMAAGEYISVSSQSDTERADLARERQELAEQPEREMEELRSIYVARGLDPELALQVAQQLTARDALSAHARDELGITAAHKRRNAAGTRAAELGVLMLFFSIEDPGARSDAVTRESRMRRLSSSACGPPSRLLERF